MKKIKYLLLALALLLVLPFKVYAAGGISLSTTSLSIEKGSSATFKVSANNAAGRIDISSANSGIANANKTSEFLDNNSVTVTVTAKEVGRTTINIVLTDVSTFDEEEKTGTLTVSINVVEPKKEEPKPSNNTNTNTNKNNNTTNVEEKKEEPVVVEKELNEEPVISEAEKKYNKALDLVKKAEKTKQIEDVNKAREAVEELEMGEDKYNLLNRLLTVMFNIDNNIKEEQEEINDGTRITTSASGTSVSWLFLSIVLLICLAIETLYIILFERRKKEGEKAEIITQ